MEENIGNMKIMAEKLLDKTLEYGPKVLLALITLWIGLKIIKFVIRLTKKGLERNKVEVSLVSFVSSLLGWGLKILLFISIASMLGIETTSFVAVIGAAGLAVGLALQGTLANFAGGALILLFRPYKVGDLIELQGHLGVVEEIEIFVTKLATPQNKTAIIPNGAASNGNIVNYTAKGLLRVDLVIGVAYEADIKQAKEVLMGVLQKDKRVLKDPAPTVAVSELADSSVNFVVRPWCTPANYWDVYFDTLANCKIALDAAKISIPFPQRDVHIVSQPQNS